MDTLSKIKMLLDQYSNLKNRIIPFDGQLIFDKSPRKDDSKKEFTEEDWKREAESFLRDSDEIISQLSQEDIEFVKFHYQVADELVEYTNRKRIDNCQPIDRLHKKKRGSNAQQCKIDEMDAPSLEEPFTGCLEKLSAMAVRAELLRWLKEKYESRLTSEVPKTTITDTYGKFVFEMDGNHVPISVLYDGKRLNIAEVRLRFFWIMLQSCYFKQGCISLDELFERLPGCSEGGIRKYQSEVNAKLRRVLGTDKNYIVAVGKSKPNHLKLAFQL